MRGFGGFCLFGGGVLTLLVVFCVLGGILLSGCLVVFSCVLILLFLVLFSLV